MTSLPPFKKLNQADRGTKFSDWFKKKNDFKLQRPFALITANFVNARVLGDDNVTAMLPTSVFERLVKDTEPRLLTREALRAMPELTNALNQVWRRMPRFCLIVPAREAACYSLAILGRQQQPDPALLANLVSALEERAFEINQLADQDMEAIPNWSKESSPTIVVDKFGRPILLNPEAAKFYGESTTTHLESLLGRLTSVQLQKKKKELFEQRQLEIDARIDLARGSWRATVSATVIHEAVAIVLKDIKQIDEPIHSLPPGIETRQTNSLRARRSSKLVPRGNILCWLHCDPLPPLALGPKFEITLGRHDHNDLVLPHPSVSRTHAAIKIRGPSVTLEDLSSANGTFVNGRRSEHHTVAIGDRVQIGPYEMEIREPVERSKITNCETTVHTQISFMNRDTALAGSLSETPLAELLQSLEFNQKTGTLSVISGRNEAYFSVVKGHAHSAQIGPLKDAEAVLSILNLTEGHFTFSNQAPSQERRMNTTITSLLLEASRRIDEGIK
ncbi:MAG: FHA domain-containing protein [Planctomycetota bacterium]|nr:FHA domain-containing protein [Planctomycetota bacterium]